MSTYHDEQKLRLAKELGIPEKHLAHYTLTNLLQKKALADSDHLSRYVKFLGGVK